MSDLEPPSPAPEPLPMPPPPLSELGAAAVALHELYRTYVYAGFTESQAFEITLVALRSVWPGVR